MNFFDKNYYFKLAKKKDIFLILDFLKKYWRQDHLLVKDYKFFEYEYCDKEKVNFVIAFNKKNKKINALQGFIPYSSDKKYLHICGSITLVKPNIKTPLLGIETMKRMFVKTKPFSYCGIGTNPTTMKPLVEKFFKRYTDIMYHHYYLNPDVSKFKIAKIEEKFIGKSLNNKIFFTEIKKFKDLNKKINFKRKFSNLPFKSKSYIKKRYFEHPKFNYKFFIIEKKNLLISREIFIKKYNKAILSIVDFVGETKQLGKINNLLNELMKVKNYEYIDILCTKNISKILVKSGFKIKDEKSKNIIPIYFQPFVRKNIKIFYETSNKNMVLFKADADQDRPN